jgi:ABC-type branched-subunit amino acid transport system substrate-binding protein
MKASVESNRSTHKQFVTSFIAKYGTSPSAYADYAYDALRVIVDTLIAKGLNATSTQMKDHMHQATFTDTATRDVRFDGNGDVTGGSYIPYKILCNDTSCSTGSFVPYA